MAALLPGKIDQLHYKGVDLSWSTLKEGAM